MKITKQRIKELIKEEMQNLSEQGNLSDAAIVAIRKNPTLSRVFKLIQQKKNNQIYADLLVKIHNLVRPDGEITDLFSRARGASQAAAKTQASAEPEAQ